MSLSRVALTVTGVMVFQFSFSQRNYLPGYVVSLNGDTVRGHIDYRGWETNPNRIEFKTNNEIKSYTPIDIKGFGTQDDKYESAILTTEIGQFADLLFKNDTTFLRTIFGGTKSLYFYKERNQGRERFYIKDKSTYELLLYKTYVKEQTEGGLNVQVENKKYIGQLSLYLADCPGIQKKLSRLSYSKNSIEKLFLSYFECTHADIYFKKTEKIDLEYGLVAGVSVTSVEFGGDPKYKTLINANYKQSTNASAGLFLNVILAGNQKKLSIYNELLYTAFEVEGSYYEAVSANQYSLTYSKIGNSLLKINNMLRYKYPIKKAFLFLNGGLTTGFAITETNYIRTEYTFYSSTTVKEGQAMDSPKKLEVGFIAGLGFSLNKYDFNIRLEQSGGFSPYVTLQEHITVLYFLAGYRF
jgi:hypothetical protein